RWARPAIDLRQGRGRATAAGYDRPSPGGRQRQNAEATTNTMSTIANANTDSIACWTVQVFSVVFTSMFISRPTSQKPESLTWPAKTDPAAVARVIATIWSSL